MWVRRIEKRHYILIIPLIEPSSFRYIRINPATNRVHLLVPFIAGQDISTDNTCKSELELKAFFEGGAVSELESYKSTLEFHISLLEEGALRQAKEARLAQINTYLAEVIGMRNSYQAVVNGFLSKPSNLYSIQLRPHTQDPYSGVVNPVFTINRSNDSRGTPLSPLYNKMHEVFPTLTIGQLNPHQKLITAVLDALPANASFETMQDLLTEHYIKQLPETIGRTVQGDFFKSIVDRRRGRQTVDKSYINQLMGFSENETPKNYIEALLRLCAPSFETSQEGSPFYTMGEYTNNQVKAERLSIMTQFYLGVMNIYCRAKEISDNNFGEILDGSSTLSQALVKTVSHALSNGDDVERSLVDFCNLHAEKEEFNLSHTLDADDITAIQEKFETTWRTVTATKENPHMDDFMLLDTKARGESDRFFTHQGLICTDFANIAPASSQNQPYFDAVRQEAVAHPKIIAPQAEPTITVDIEPEALMDKLGDVQWDRLPKEVVDSCRALPAFQVRHLLLLDDVAKGKQNEANAILEASTDLQTLLRTSGKFTDYSGRTFNCTAYEYAWWAKDTHMRRMLESHMDDETKTLLLEKIDEIERSGVEYLQHGVAYKNPHYDMSFVLKDLNVEEFRQLKTLVGQDSAKIQQSTADNYQTIPFTATEYEALKKALEKHKPWRIASFFYTSPATAISNKLQFDFHSLITALETYVSNYDRWGHHELEMAWLAVGKAQRDVPAHIAHEYCRDDRSFDPRPEFNEDALPRILTFDNYVTNVKSWFPLDSSSSGLGFDFSLFRDGRARGRGGAWRTGAAGWLRPGLDLAAVSHLDEVRTADLTLSREILERASPGLGLRL
jgi:hypothetical protein